MEKIKITTFRVHWIVGCSQLFTSTTVLFARIVACRSHRYNYLRVRIRGEPRFVTSDDLFRVKPK